MSDIRFNCERCGQHLAAPAEITGTTIPCPSCGSALLVPALASPKPQVVSQEAYGTAATAKETPTTLPDRRLSPAQPKQKLGLTLSLIGVNVGIFVAMLNASPSATVLLAWGADWGPLTGSGQWWRLLTACFLHWSPAHLFGNMYALLAWGPWVERLLGKGFYLAIYFASGLAASLTSVWWHPLAVSAGASGAVFGVCGALPGCLVRLRRQAPRGIIKRLLNGAVIFIAANLVAGLTNGHIDHAAHIGGLLSGGLFGWMAARPLGGGSWAGLTKRAEVRLAASIAVVLACLFLLVPRSHPKYASILNSLGVTYANGESVPRDDAAAAKWYRKAAALGCPEAMFNLGRAYSQGLGVAKDPAEAVRWWRQAGEAGMTNAPRLVALHYYRGEGVERDYAEAARWLRKAAEQGDIESQNYLGLMYRHGEGVERNDAEAASWFRKAADQGHADAQCNLGALCLNAPGAEKDYVLAEKYSRKAADHGLAQAQYNLGIMYNNGWGVTKSFTEAARWYRLAAAQNFAEAQVNLGILYANGEGLAKDAVKAYAWLTLAADSGTPAATSAAKSRQLLAARMAPDALARASQRAAELARAITKQ